MSSPNPETEYTCEACGVVFLKPPAPGSCALCKQYESIKDYTEKGSFGTINNSDDNNSFTALFDKDDDQKGILHAAKGMLMSAHETILQGFPLLNSWLGEAYGTTQKEAGHFAHYIDIIKKHVRGKSDLLDAVERVVTNYNSHAEVPENLKILLSDRSTLKTSIALVELRSFNLSRLATTTTADLTKYLDAAAFQAIATIFHPQTATFRTALEECTAIYANENHDAINSLSVGAPGVEESSDDNDSDSDDDLYVDTGEPPDVDDTVDYIASAIVNSEVPNDLVSLVPLNAVAITPSDGVWENLGLFLYMKVPVINQAPKKFVVGLFAGIEEASVGNYRIFYSITSEGDLRMQPYSKDIFFLSKQELTDAGVLSGYENAGRVAPPADDTAAAPSPSDGPEPTAVVPAASTPGGTTPTETFNATAAARIEKIYGNIKTGGKTVTRHVPIFEKGTKVGDFLKTAKGTTKESSKKITSWVDTKDDKHVFHNKNYTYDKNEENTLVTVSKTAEVFFML
jgi:hypothetical protein